MAIERAVPPLREILAAAPEFELERSLSPTVEEAEDGAIIVDLRPDLTRQNQLAEEAKVHGANLAEHLGPEILAKLGEQVTRDTKDDLESRGEWEKLIANGLVELGLKMQDATEPFEGACTATHPLLIENVVKFQAKAAYELLPPAGPVRTKIYGALTEEREKRAARIKEFMNWQTMEQMVEYVDEKERLLFYYSLIGTGITKTYFDSGLNRPVSEFVPMDQFVVNYNAPDIRRAERYTHIITRTEEEFKRDVEAGIYLDVDVGSGAIVEPSEIRAKTDELLGFQQPQSYKGYTLYEQHLYADLEMEPEVKSALPYIVTVDSASGKILAVRRGWREGDNRYQRLEWFTRYVFVPGMSFYGLGLLHLIGSLAKAATMSTRALIDSGMFSNLQGGFKLRGLKITGDNQPIAPGEWKDIESPVQDIGKAIAPLPYKEPSQTLFALLQFVVAAGQKFADTTEQVISDSTNYGPVGTTLALLEASAKFFSGVHKRLHASMKQELRILRRIDEDFISGEYPFEVEGASRSILRSDFNSDIDIVPASDPNTPSNAHRVTKATTVMQMATQHAGMHDMREVLKQAYLAMDVANIDKILPPPEKPIPLDPLSDIARASQGKPIAAFPGQDHDAHIRVKMSFMQDPTAGGSPLFQAVSAVLAANIREHTILKYVETAQAQAQMAAQQNPMIAAQLADPRVQAQMQAAAAQQVSMQAVQQAQMAAQQAQGQDPTIALGMAELQQRSVEHNDKKIIQAAEIAVRNRELDIRQQAEQTKQYLQGAKIGVQANASKQDAKLKTGKLALDAAKVQTNNYLKGADIGSRASAEQKAQTDQQARFAVDTLVKVASESKRRKDRGEPNAE